MDSHDDQTHDAIDKPAKITAPQGVSGQRADGTLTATIRMLTARAMLRHGGDPAVVATTTRVPQALVEVMADMADTPTRPNSQPSTSGRCGGRPAARLAGVPADRHLWRQEIDRNGSMLRPVRPGHTEDMPKKRRSRTRRTPPRAASAGSNPAFLGDLGMTPKRSTAPLPEADDDRHASVRVRLAALMLRRGDDVGDVSVATDVPVVLLELLRAEVADETDLDQQRQATVDDVRRRRRVVIAVLIMEVAALANIVIGLIALIGHLAGLGLLASVIGPALLLAVYVVARCATPTGSRTGYSPRYAARRKGRDRGPGD